MTANPQLVEVNYSKPVSNLILNVALLGIGMQTDVARGENKGRVLNQDFVVLSHDVYSASNDGWKVKLPKYASNLAQKYALAIWLSEMDDISPVQETGYWIPSEWGN